MIGLIVGVILLVLFIAWAAVLQRKRSAGGIRPEEAGRDKGWTYLP